MEKRWFIGVISVACLFLLFMGIIIVIIDPFFHYHKPLKSMGYRIDLQRYQNDGILRNFDYDAVIIGTSTAENFKTSEMDMLFNSKTVKVPYSGAGLKEIHDALQRAIKSNSDLKIIVWGLNYHQIFQEKNYMPYKEYPTYLYDDNLVNDVKYIFNASVFQRSIKDVVFYTIQGNDTTNFDDYSNWNSVFKFGKEEVLKWKVESPVAKGQRPNLENIEYNILSLVISNPNIEFYFFWSPYSIATFNACNREKTLDDFFIAEKEAFQMILPYSNVHFFSLFDDFDIITNFNNFKDTGHCHEDINSYILKCMQKGNHQVTLENYEDYRQRCLMFYESYDYDSIYQ